MTTKIHLQNFYCVSCPAVRMSATGHASGDVVVAYNQRLGSMKPVLTEDNCVVLEGERVNSIAMYVRPPGCESTMDLVEKLTRCLLLTHNKGKTTGAGDLNARLDKR